MARVRNVDETRFVRKVLILIGLIGAIGLAIVLRDLLLLIFGSIVVSVLLTSIANPLQRWTKVSRGLALTASIFVLVGVIGGVGALLGTQAIAQAKQLETQVPAAWNVARERLGGWGLELPAAGSGETRAEDESADERQPEDGDAAGFGELGKDMLGRVGGWVMAVFGAIAHTLLVIAGGIYLAAQPQLYRSGIIKLIPKAKRQLASTAYDESGEALRLWMLGTFVSMGVVGLVTGFGLWLIGVPSPIALGMLAGLLEFVPIVGPIAASVPAILMAFSQSPEMALWTVAMFVGVQQLEGNVIQPLVQRFAVDLPPALLLFSVVAGGYLFGIVGFIFAAPLTVVTFVLVKRLYVREALDTEVQLPADKGP